uniref:Uncharacterized protein n=1 Tax=Anopheles merus TaxID=30066 RepID=A0A182UWY3_ANOME
MLVRDAIHGRATYFCEPVRWGGAALPASGGTIASVVRWPCATAAACRPVAACSAPVRLPPCARFASRYAEDSSLVAVTFFARAVLNSSVGGAAVSDGGGGGAVCPTPALLQAVDAVRVPLRRVVRVVLAELVARVQQLRLLRLQPQLLLANYRAGAAHAQPGDRFRRGKPVVLDQVRTDQRAVDGHGTAGRLADLQELLQYVVVRIAAVREDQIVMLEARLGERLRIVLAHVEAHHGRDVVAPEVLQVGVRPEHGHPVRDVRLAVRAAEREKLARHDPVQVAVVHPLVVLVRGVIKVLEVEEVALVRFQHPAEAVLERQVAQLGLGRIAVLGAARVLQHGRERLHCALHRRVQLLVEPLAVPVQHREVQRPEVAVKVFVHQLLVRGEVERFFRLPQAAVPRHYRQIEAT